MKISKISFGFCLYIFIALLLMSTLLISANSYATPVLQINIPGSQYTNGGTGPFNDGFITHDSSFILQAILNPSESEKNNSPDPLWEHYLSCSLMNLEGKSTTTLSDSTSLKIDGVNYTAEQFSHGIPEQMPPHGVFETYYVQIPFIFGESDFTQNGVFNVQDLSEGGGTSGYIHNFNVNVEGLDNKYALVFDLFTYDLDSSKNKLDCFNNKEHQENQENKHNTIIFAPFSHNGAAVPNSSHPVPIPGTFLLVGFSLTVMAGLRKKLP